MLVAMFTNGLEENSGVAFNEERNDFFFFVALEGLVVFSVAASSLSQLSGNSIWSFSDPRLVSIFEAIVLQIQMVLNLKISIG